MSKVPGMGGAHIFKDPSEKQQIQLRRPFRTVKYFAGSVGVEIVCELGEEEVCQAYHLIIQDPIFNERIEVQIDVQEIWEQFISGVTMFPKIGEKPSEELFNASSS